jgi:SAM-dependent methyltransferase
MNQLNLNNYKQEIADLYTQRSDKYDDSNWHWRIANRLVEYGQVSSGQKILDIATGTGHCAFSAAELVGERGKVIGIDISPGLTSSRRRSRGIPKTHDLGFCFLPLRVLLNCPLELCLSGLMSDPQTITASPAASIFFPALMSLSMSLVSQLGQSQVRIAKDILAITNPQW